MCFLIDRDEKRERTRKYPLSYNHFFPLSKFKEEPYDNYNPYRARVVDTLTGDRFNNDDRSTLRIKCLLLSLTVPVIYTILALIDILDKLFVFINKIGNLIVHLIAYYLHGIYQEDADPIMKQVVDLIKLPVQVVLAPVCVVLLELATLYGLVCPYIANTAKFS